MGYIVDSNHKGTYVNCTALGVFPDWKQAAEALREFGEMTRYCMSDVYETESYGLLVKYQSQPAELRAATQLEF